MPVSAEYAETKWQPRQASATRSRPSSVRLGSLPADSAQDLRFVQDRIALFAQTTFLISGMFLIAAIAGERLRGASFALPLGRAGHVLATLIALVLWRFLRSRRNLLPGALQSVDVIGTLGICVSFVALGHHALQPYGFYTGLLAVTHTSITRAMIVPSVPQRTFVLALLSFAGFVVSRSLLPPAVEFPELPGARARALLEVFLWSVAGTAVATVASKVIYGLHEKALEARQLGQYALEEKIGEGGMGEIYRASHAMLRRPTAVKLLLGPGSEAELRRFEKEVQLTARLTHPNTISIYDYGRTPEGVFYYAMELLDGLTLEQLVERDGVLPPGRVIYVLRQVCGALHEAHHIGLIHRDIKPANIYLCQSGAVPDFVKVLDFGLVHEVRGDGSMSLSVSEGNIVVGTPLYMAPESILKPRHVDGRADLYGLGAVAYYLLTGSPPFSGDSVVEICAHHLHTPVEPPSWRRPTPHDLEEVVLSCLAKDPAARPQSARELSSALAACHDAGTWGEHEAEAWWASTSVLKRGSTVPPASGEQPRRTVCCVDLERRLAKDTTGT